LAARPGFRAGSTGQATVKTPLDVRRLLRFLPLFVLLSVFALLLAGCDADVPQNTFDDQGPVARDQERLFLLAMWPAIVVMIGVLAACVIILLRFRRRSPDEVPVQTHGNTRLELTWTIAPALLMLGLGIPMLVMIWDQGGDPPADAYHVNVIGQRFSWEFQYPDIVDESGNPVSVFNEAHIPVGRDVAFHLRSIDVIHSFWLPKLGGKLDVIPCIEVPLADGATKPPDDPKAPGVPDCIGGSVNTLVLKADRAQTLHGQCVELCGTGHGDMKMIVHADDEADFEAWADEMRGGGSAGGEATPTATPSAAARSVGR